MPYISGPMRSKAQDRDDPWNFAHFFAEELRLRGAGVTDISNPARIDMEHDHFDPADPLKNVPQDQAHYVQRDVDEIMSQDGISRLRGWVSSHGAVAEDAIGRWLGKPRYDAPDPTPELLERAFAEMQKIREAWDE